MTIDFGFEGPSVSMDTEYFVEHWFDFIMATGYETILLTDDPAIFGEFERHYDLFRSKVPVAGEGVIAEL